MEEGRGKSVTLDTIYPIMPKEPSLPDNLKGSLPTIEELEEKLEGVNLEEEE